MVSILLIVLVILFLDSIVSASEAAILAVSLNRVRQLAEKSSNARVLLELKESMARPIATLIALSNLITILGSVLVGWMTSRLLGEVWVGVVGAFLTFLIMVFAEIIPKRLGERYSEIVALIMARPTKTIATVFTPIVWLIEKISGPFVKKGEISISKEELVFLTHQSAKEGAIAPYEEQLITGIFKLSDVTAGDMMTPKPFVFFLDGNKTLKEVWPILQKISHSRIPVFEGNKDKIIGIVHQKELLSALVEGRGEALVKDHAKKSLVVPESRLGDDLLKDFLASKTHLAIVVDDYGAVVGIVGLEDVLEEIVGEIVDEKDVSPELIKRVAKNVIVAHGQTNIAHINHFFNTNIPSKLTLNGFLLRKFGHLPAVGESLKMEKENIVFTIEDVSSSSIERVRIAKEEI